MQTAERQTISHYEGTDYGSKEAGRDLFHSFGLMETATDFVLIFFIGN